MGEFVRDRLPDPVSYFEGAGLTLRGPGRWKTTRCEFHGGSDSMRINADTGAWVCMACGEKGGDALAYAMRSQGLEFVQAARLLGAYDDEGQPQRTASKAATLSARDAMEVLALSILTVTLVISDIRRGVIPTDEDWSSFLDCADRIEALVMEFRT